MQVQRKTTRSVRRASEPVKQNPIILHNSLGALGALSTHASLRVPDSTLFKQEVTSRHVFRTPSRKTPSMISVNLTRSRQTHCYGRSCVRKGVHAHHSSGIRYLVPIASGFRVPRRIGGTLTAGALPLPASLPNRPACWQERLGDSVKPGPLVLR